MPEQPVRNCPFYGFRSHLELLLLAGSAGNQCALRVESVSPCRMERDGGSADWPNCTHFNTKEYTGMVKAMRDNYSLWVPGSSTALFEGWFLEHGGQEVTSADPT